MATKNSYIVKNTIISALKDTYHYSDGHFFAPTIVGIDWDTQYIRLIIAY